MLGEVTVSILMVEDDDAIAAPLGRALDREGYQVRRVATGGEALTCLAGAEAVHLVLLDLGLPDMDGLDVCRRARADGYDGGILILTARGDELDRVVGLDVGADDYLAKPFSLSELLARSRALLRRSARGEPSAEVTAHSEPQGSTSRFRVDAEARRVWVDSTELSLTAKEFDVLVRLHHKPGAVITRETLMAEVWDENWFGSTKTLDTTVGRLRQKLVDCAAPVTVTTVRGVGFRLENSPGHA